MLTLYIVRHGETEENAAGILQGHLQGHLSELGKEQARQLRQYLTTLTPPQDIWVSDLQRTIDTANILNQSFHLPLHPCELLRERDWGELTGHSIAHLPKEFPSSVESIPHLLERARNFLEVLQQTYHHEDRYLLVVTHGLYSRALQAVILNKEMHEIPRMQNGEIRILQISTNDETKNMANPVSHLSLQQDEIEPLDSES